MPTIALNIGTGSGGVGFSQITLQALLNFGEMSAQVVDYALTNQNSPATAQAFPLSSGNTTINATVCPALASAGGVFICPGPGNGTLLTLKGASGDTGIVLNLTAPTFIPFNVSPPTSFVLYAASTCATLVLVWI
jgi:hypothetical protein